ncbi:MAG: hypothetical protein V5A62_03855 [Haloarculaceae archaeon]
MSARGGLPEPGAVPGRAADLAAATAGASIDPGAVNVHVGAVDGGFDPTTVQRGNTGGYEGPNAGDLGRLAAAVGAVERVDEADDGAADADGDVACLHYPEPAGTAAGPWLVVEPLDGRLSTVHAGRGRLVVELAPPPAGVDAGLRAVRGALVDLIEAVRPEHEHYPVGRDSEGVFTRGMTTLSLAGVDTGREGTTVRFDVSTTPETRSEGVEELVSDLSGVRSATYEQVADLVRSTPPAELLRAAESAAERAVGDWEYEWYHRPTAFSRLSSSSKLALGTGRPGEETFDGEQFEGCRVMVRETVARYGGS